MPFKSYVDYKVDNGKVDTQGIMVDETDDNGSLQAALLAGEVVVACAENVLKFDAFSDQKRGVSGSLYCTNFKLIFVTADPFSQANELKLKNQIIDENDICLSNIASVYQGTGVKKKKFPPGSSVSGKVKNLLIECKNFRVHTYSFKFSPVGNDKSVVNAILHHAYPAKLSLLFAFEYQPTSTRRQENVLRYETPSEWRLELDKCQVNNGWRISQVNEAFRTSDSLPESFVVPIVPVDAHLIRGAPHFTGHRLLKWCWGNKHGNCVVRMAALDPGIIESRQLQIMTDYVQNCHPSQKQPRTFTLEDLVPNYKEIQSSFLKLKSFCIAESSTEFWDQDALFKTGMESSKWLHNVSLCLSVAKDAASTILFEKTSVILLENDDRDMNCVISSLVQLILDPRFRTVQGFQSLIQKEWVAMGHRFSIRFNQLLSNDPQESPIFLLFLDCVWQLMCQFPAVFEFTETYLTVLWDSTKLMIFETFLFDSPKQRMDAIKYSAIEDLHLHTVWDWNVQFSPQETELFINPLYVVSYEIHNYMQTIVNHEQRYSRQERLVLRPDRQVLSRMLSWNRENLLDIKTQIVDLEIWDLCYFRWLPFSQVTAGGSSIMVFEQQRLACDILDLMKTIYDLKTKLGDKTKHKYPDPTFQFKKSLARYKVIKNSVSSSFPFSNDVATDHRSGYTVPILLHKTLSDSNRDLSTLD